MQSSDSKSCAVALNHLHGRIWGDVCGVVPDQPTKRPIITRLNSFSDSLKECLNLA